MDWPTVATSTISAVLVAFLAPRFQHFVWRSQRLREQRMNVADRFANTAFSMHTTVDDYANAHLQLTGLLVVIQIVFNDPETLRTATAFKNILNNWAPAPDETAIKAHYSLRVHLYACLLAEAFSISLEKLRDRATQGQCY